MKDVSVVNSWMLSQTGTKAELIRLFLTECCSRFREVPRKFLCVERTQTRLKRLMKHTAQVTGCQQGKPFHASPLREPIGMRFSPPVAGVKIGVLKEPLNMWANPRSGIVGVFHGPR